jgi:hypothetical protein
VPQPTPPVLPYNFSSELGSTFGLHLDADFQALVDSTNEIIDNLALIQRDDGDIRNQTVSADAFTSDALALMAGSSVASDLDWRPRGDWVTATLYDVGNIVQTGSPAIAYVCSVEHVSGVFATDYAAGKWVVLSSPRTLVSADITGALGFTPVNKAGDTMTGALVMVTGSKIGGASGMTFTDTLLASQDLITINKGFYSNFQSTAGDQIYGFAANIVRESGAAATVGAQCSAIGMTGVGNTLFGSNFNAWGLAGCTATMVAQELDVGCFNPSNSARKVGLNPVFFNRGGTNPGEYNFPMPSGTYSSAGGGLGANLYNYDAWAIYITSQQRSATGEYCGWNRGLLFDEYSLDSQNDASYTGSRQYPIGIDFSALHYYGGTDPVTAFNLEAAMALRDFQTIWWNRDPATAATATDKVKTYFNPAVSRWVIENGGTERVGFNTTTGDIYQNGSLVVLPGLASNNVWTSAGSNEFEGPVEIASTFTFTGSSRRISGDFSNASVPLRTMFQTSTANSATEVGVMPNGTGGVSALYLLSQSDAADCQVGRISVSGAQFEITSGVVGAAGYVPIIFGVGGLELMRMLSSPRQVVINSNVAGIAAASFRVNGIIQCDNTVSFSVHRAGVNFSVANNTPTVIDFTTEVFDTNASYDIATNRFTPPAGKYALMGAVCNAAATGVDQGAIVVLVYKNGVQEKSGNFATMSGTGPTGSHVSCIVDANGTDYFELLISQVTGGNLICTGAATDTYFQGYRIG